MALIMHTVPAKKVKVRSFTRDAWYVVNVLTKECGCPKFKQTGTCKHLDALGLHVKRPFTPKTNPSYSQALCALVKSLRIRRVEEAVYWMLYMDGSQFSEQQYRFRMARRLLIGTAEDGHAIPVMEKCSQNFPKLCKKSTEMLYLVAEALRICKLPNWWHPDSGGPSYIYQSLVGQREWMYRKWDHKLPTLQEIIVKAVDDKDPATALGGVMAFGALKEPVGATKQAEWLLELAENREHELAARLCEVHLSQKGALSGDNNFLVQAVWMLAGGVSPVAEKIEPVTAGECYELIKQAKEAWKTPHPVPTWACDGIHCAGNDTRFMGMFPEMYAVVKAFEHYGRIEPTDEWLPEFMVYDGLQLEWL